MRKDGIAIAGGVRVEEDGGEGVFKKAFATLMNVRRHHWNPQLAPPASDARQTSLLPSRLPANTTCTAANMLRLRTELERCTREVQCAERGRAHRRAAAQCR